MIAPLSPRQVKPRADAFAGASDDDPEIQAHGRYFTCSYLLDMDRAHFVVQVSRGEVRRVAVDPGPLDGPTSSPSGRARRPGANSARPVPAPMFHGIWSASFQRDMKLEGDFWCSMQNLRCFTRQIELLRTVGVPV